MVLEILAVSASWTIIIGGLLYLVVKLTIKSMLADFLKDLNGTYQRTPMCKEISKGFDSRLNILEENQKELTQYCHYRMHEIANKAQIVLSAHE